MEIQKIDISYNTSCAWEDWNSIKMRAKNLRYNHFVERLIPHKDSLCEQIELQTMKLKILIERKIAYEEALLWLTEDQLNYTQQANAADNQPAAVSGKTES